MTATAEKTGLDYEKLLKVKKVTKNIIEPADSGWDAVSGFLPADKRMRGLMQNIIDTVDEHKHLRKAHILLLLKDSPADAKRIEKGNCLLHLGHAQRCAAKHRAMMAAGLTAECVADFVITLSCDWLQSIGATYDGGELRDCQGVRKMAALMDHELSHCSAVIAGKWISEEKEVAEIEAFGEAYLDKPERNGESGQVFIRYYKLKNGKFQWKMKRHEVEEFTGVIGRHGVWSSNLKSLVDVIDGLDDEAKTLFD